MAKKQNTEPEAEIISVDLKPERILLNPSAKQNQEPSYLPIGNGPPMEAVEVDDRGKATKMRQMKSNATLFERDGTQRRAWIYPDKEVVCIVCRAKPGCDPMTKNPDEIILEYRFHAKLTVEFKRISGAIEYISVDAIPASSPLATRGLKRTYVREDGKSFMTHLWTADPLPTPEQPGPRPIIFGRERTEEERMIPLMEFFTVAPPIVEKPPLRFIGEVKTGPKRR